MILLFVYLGVALVFSFLCSIAEAVLLSINRGYINALEEKRPATAQRLRRFRDNPEEPLSAILTLNTVAHTVGAAGVGHQAAVLFGEQWLGVYSAVLTLLILVGSEIIPKTLGAVHWRQLAPLAGLMVQMLVSILYPIIVALRVITNRISNSTPAERSRDEIESTVQLASESQHLTSLESNMLVSVLGLRRVAIREIMTPQVVLFAVPDSMTIGDYLALHADSPFSRIPLFGESKDSITGYVLRSSILNSADQGAELSTIRREISTAFEASRASDIYSQMIAGNHHIAIVVNEFGGTAGIVTLEDILETLIGHEIIDELDPATDMREAARELGRKRDSESGS
jgi:CBS domain containing-hemolysin-like protein